jgi:hypothetical protein
MYRKGDLCYLEKWIVRSTMQLYAQGRPTSHQRARERCGSYPPTATFITLAGSSHMDTIASLDARILALEQELSRLKVIRNAFSPLYHLPDELVVHVARYVVFENGALSRARLLTICAISRHLRHLFFRTRELWSYLDFSWSALCLQYFLHRAGDHLLHASRDPDVASEVEQTKTLELCMPKVASFSGRICPGPKGDVWLDVLNTPNATNLRSLSLTNPFIGWEAPVKRLSISESWSNLVTLQLVNIESIMEFPPLPTLQRLDVDGPGDSPSNIYSIISQAPRLRWIKLVSSLADIPESWKPERPVELPDLESLTIEDKLPAVHALLGMLPNPRIAFKIIVYPSFVNEPEVHAWSSERGPHGVIVSRLLQFWTAVTEAEFPPGFLICQVWGNVQPYISFEPSDHSGTQVTYRARAAITTPDPLLSHICALMCHNNGNQCHTLLPSDVDLELLPNIGSLIISYAPSEEPEDIRRLEDWLTARRTAGTALLRIGFSKCNEVLRPFYHRLRANRVATRIKWERDGVDDESDDELTDEEEVYSDMDSVDGDT